MCIKKRFLITVLAVCLSFSLAACSSQSAGDKKPSDSVSSVSVNSAKSEESPASDSQSSTDENQAESESDLPSNNSEDYLTDCSYSSDNNVCLKITRDQYDYDKDVAVIIDGDKEIPVDIETGVYGAYIEKFDCDGDGEDEYLIAECEGTGSGCSQYGLCIVEKSGEDYKLTRYDSAFFSDILGERIKTEYNKEYNEVGLIIDGRDDLFVDRVYPGKVDPEIGTFDSFCWTDIIGIEFIDGGIWLSAPAGFVYSNNDVPQYDIEFTVTAPITVNKENKAEVGAIRPYMSGSPFDYELDPSIEKESKLNTVTCDINRDGIEDAIFVTYITDANFDGNFTENTFHDGAFGYVKVIEGNEDTKNDPAMLESGNPSWVTDYAYAHTGNRQVFLTRAEGRDYLVCTSLYDGQGKSAYEYEVFFLKNGYLYQADHKRVEFETAKKPDLKSFFDGLYSWINDDSVLLIATDVDLDPTVYWSAPGNTLNPDVYYSQRK